MSKRFNVCVTSKFESNGEERTAYHSVGKAFSGTSKDGNHYINLKIGPNLILSKASELILFEDTDDKTPAAKGDLQVDGDEIPF